MTMKSTFITFDTEKLIFALQMPGSVFTILLTVYGFWVWIWWFGGLAVGFPRKTKNLTVDRGFQTRPSCLRLIALLYHQFRM